MGRADPLSDITEASKRAFAEAFDAVLLIEPEDAAPLWIDGRQNPPTVSDKAPKGVTADCIWRATPDIVLRALASERSLDNAFISGGLFISGDMSVMARLSLKANR